MLTTEYCDRNSVTDYTQAGAGVAGILNGAKLILGTNVITPSKVDDVTLITQSADADLAPQTVAWGSAGRDSKGDIVTRTTALAVHIAVVGNACSINSWGLTDAAGAHLLMSGQVNPPMVLSDLLSSYAVVVEFAPGNPQGKELVVFS